MKIRNKINRLAVSVTALCAALAAILPTTTALGQTTYTWTGAPGDGTNLAVAVNWGGTLPATATSDTAQWDGTVAGPLNLVYNNNAWQSRWGRGPVFAPPDR